MGAGCRGDFTVNGGAGGEWSRKPIVLVQRERGAGARCYVVARCTRVRCSSGARCAVDGTRTMLRRAIRSLRMGCVGRAPFPTYVRLSSCLPSHAYVRYASSMVQQRSHGGARHQYNIRGRNGLDHALLCNRISSSGPLSVHVQLETLPVVPVRSMGFWSRFRDKFKVRAVRRAR